MTEKCGTCKFYKMHLKNMSEGLCRRSPPHVIIGPVRNPRTKEIEPSPVAVFPNMDAEDWCGEYKMKVSLQ